MAEELERESEEVRDVRPKSIKQETEDLEKVTDYAEEKEIGSVNLNHLEAINLIEAQRNRENQARDEELAKVNITREDVELIMDELQINRQEAELSLRRSNGDVVQALVGLLS